jgi:hypothetical protein
MISKTRLDWRVIFIENARLITVVAVGNRKEIYD